MPKSATARLPEMSPVLDSPFVRDGISPSPHELQFAVFLPESDVEALALGTVTARMQQSAIGMLRLRDGR